MKIDNIGYQAQAAPIVGRLFYEVNPSTVSLSMGKKMQSVKFQHVNEFLDYLPEEELRVTEALRELILETIPNCREKLSYNVPCYHRHKSIGFLWPGSVL